jgi:hypothetical protein
MDWTAMGDKPANGCGNVNARPTHNQDSSTQEGRAEDGTEGAGRCMSLANHRSRPTGGSAESAQPQGSEGQGRRMRGPKPIDGAGRQARLTLDSTEGGTSDGGAVPDAPLHR